MANPTQDEIIAIYKREAAREAEEPGFATTHASVLQATRTHVQHLLRQLPEAAAASDTKCWTQADALIKAAGIWDKAPEPEAVAETAPVPVPPPASKKKVSQ